jgi:hypothetical protein
LLDDMTVTLAAWARYRVALVAVSMLVALAGCSIPAEPGVAGSMSSTGTLSPSPMQSVELLFGDHAVIATLVDTPPARQFAAMLPLTVQLKDVWGQAKSGPLPHMLTVEGSTPIHDPIPGGSTSGPGVVNAGPDSLANAGGPVTVWIDLVAASSG